jgi:hypothetical protein
MSIEPIQEKHLKDLHDLIRTFKDRMSHLVGPSLMEFFPLPPADYQDLPPDRVAGYVNDCHTVLRHVKGLYDFFMERVVEGVTSAPSPDSSPGDLQRLSYRFEVRRLTRFPDQRPVFIVGARYSGTRTMTESLRSGAGWFGWPEGHLFATLPVLLSAVSKTWQDICDYEGEPKDSFALGQVDVYRILNHMVQLANQTYADAPGAREGGRWVDNSPGTEGLIVVPLLGHLYPNAKFIFMHCQPLRSIRSHLQGHPQASVEFAGMMWILSMRSWYQVRKSLRSENFLELGLVDLIRNTDDTVGRLASLLGLTDRQAGAVRSFIISQRPRFASPEQLTGGYLEDTDWPEVVRNWFKEIGEPTARYWGYQLTRPAGVPTSND